MFARDRVTAYGIAIEKVILYPDERSVVNSFIPTIVVRTTFDRLAVWFMNIGNEPQRYVL